MKTRIAIALSFITILAVPSAYGQNVLGHIDIPFKFMIAKREMPAGKYEVSTMKGEAVGRETRLVVSNYEKNISVYVPVIEHLAETDPSQKHHARVVFDDVGDQRFLSEFWPADKGDGFLLGIKKGEQKHEVVEER